MNNLEKVYVFALCNVYYDSFYIKGIQEIVGRKKVCFDTLHFPKFSQNTFAVIFKFKEFEIKVIIDSRDTSDIWEEELKWCDVYGKVNYNFYSIDEKLLKKIVPIGPSFGIKIWSLYKTVGLGLINSFFCRNQITNVREYLANYWRQYKRLKLEEYYNTNEIATNYVFFVSSIWKKEQKTNLNRLNFIKGCKSINKINFEGGFVPRKDNDNLGLDSFLTSKRYELKEYILKTKQSEFVFNTPAVVDCHGWKLAEYLAMGKVIVSSAHINFLPKSLEENLHLVYVESDYQIVLVDLISNEKKKKILSKNASDYFQQNLTPKRVVESLLEKYSILSTQ